MMRLMSLALAAALPLQLAAAEFNFCWAGGGGYTMTGQIAFPDRLMSASMITEADVTGFRITGYEHGVAIGHWDMQSRRPGTTWHLRFDPQTLTFPTGGNYPGEQSQGWNANGEVTDCGRKGFGFNSGNYAQDLCLYGVWISQSSIPPSTPFRATTGPVSIDCRVIDHLS